MNEAHAMPLADAAIEVGNTTSSLPESPADTEERALDFTLRPRKLDEFIGQDKVKENLGVFLEAARRRGEPIEHVLLYGSPGLGKTTLAHVIANEMGANIVTTSGPALERVGDLAAILTNRESGDILFIDEIHRLPKTVEEVLYPAMEEFALDIVVGKGPSARTLRLDLPRFTIIGATTRPSLLSAPLRDRFGLTEHLDYYEEADVQKIVTRSATLLAVTADQESLKEIARRSRRTPRVANRLLRRVRDFAQVHGTGVLTSAIAKEALSRLEIDEYGLTRVDRDLLLTMILKFNGGPVGLNSLAAATSEDMETIESVYEPFLLRLGFLQRTPRGRMATELAYKHLGRDVPAHRTLL